MIDPESIRVDDQWRLGDDPAINDKDSYFTFSVSDSIEVPATLVERRKREYDELIAAGYSASMSPEERVGAARQGAQSVISSIEYGQKFQDLMRLATASGIERNARKLEELRELADGVLLDEREAEGGRDHLLVRRDRESLLRSLKARMGASLDGATSWREVVERLRELERAAQESDAVVREL